jgi:hypothetical protein
MAAQKYSDMYILPRNATHDIYMRSRVRSKSPDRVRRCGGVPLGAYAPPLGCIPLPMTASSKPPSIATHSTEHSTMEGLPTELIEYIASFACTDDGSTGRALSAVSRAVRESTAAFRFHALALRGARQISAFVALLDSLGDPANNPLPETWEKRRAVPVTRPIVHVRHLFLEDCVEYRARSRKPTWTEWQTYAPGLSKFGDPVAKTIWASLLGTRTGLAEWRKSSEIAAATIHKLFSYLAGTLQHVCFIHHLSSLATFGRVRLPALVELTYSCAYDGLHLCEVDEPYYLTIMEDAPALLRLHYVSIEGKQSPSRVIASGALMLTHFRHSSTLNVVRTLDALSAEAAQPGWPPRLENIQISPVVSYRRPVAIRSDSFAGYVNEKHMNIANLQLIDGLCGLYKGPQAPQWTFQCMSI